MNEKEWLQPMLDKNKLLAKFSHFGLHFSCIMTDRCHYDCIWKRKNTLALFTSLLTFFFPSLPFPLLPSPPLSFSSFLFFPFLSFLLSFFLCVAKQYCKF